MSTTELGLGDLREVELGDAEKEAVEQAESVVQGSAAWKRRKIGELTEILALSLLAARLRVLAIDARTELQLLLRLFVPVPCLATPDPDTSFDALEIAGHADLAVRYPEEILRGPLPGHALVQILAPRSVWHPNVGYAAHQRMCLGVSVVRGLPLKEVVLQAFAALSLQAITLDERDPAGLMNRMAIAVYRENPERVPLTSAPFLAAPDHDPDMCRGAAGTSGGGRS